jgi:hypothetical protein
MLREGCDRDDHFCFVLMLKREKLSEQLVLTSHWTICWTIGCLKKRIGRSLATLGRIIKANWLGHVGLALLAWPCWLGYGCRADKGRWLSIGQLVVETNLVDCHKGHERYSRCYVSAIAETCQRGTVEQNCRTELLNIAVEQRGF